MRHWGPIITALRAPLAAPSPLLSGAPRPPATLRRLCPPRPAADQPPPSVRFPATRLAARLCAFLSRVMQRVCALSCHASCSASVRFPVTRHAARLCAFLPCVSQRASARHANRPKTPMLRPSAHLGAALPLRALSSESAPVRSSWCSARQCHCACGLTG